MSPIGCAHKKFTQCSHLDAKKKRRLFWGNRDTILIKPDKLCFRKLCLRDQREKNLGRGRCSSLRKVCWRIPRRLEELLPNVSSQIPRTILIQNQTHDRDHVTVVHQRTNGLKTTPFTWLPTTAWTLTWRWDASKTFCFQIRSLQRRMTWNCLYQKITWLV